MERGGPWTSHGEGNPDCYFQFFGKEAKTMETSDSDSSNGLSHYSPLYIIMYKLEERKEAVLLNLGWITKDY